MPLPLQTPGLPLHSLSGSVPAETLVHVPVKAPRLHVLQVPVHAVSQHLLSTQKPDKHSFALLHPEPFDSLHTPAPSQEAV